MSWGFSPRPTDSEPCGSKSTSSTFRPYSASDAPRLIVVVVLPTPPFWLVIDTTRAGPCSVRALGSGRSGIGRPVGPTTEPIMVWPAPSSSRRARSNCSTSDSVAGSSSERSGVSSSSVLTSGTVVRWKGTGSDTASPDGIGGMEGGISGALLPTVASFLCGPVTNPRRDRLGSCCAPRPTQVTATRRDPGDLSTHRLVRRTTGATLGVPGGRSTTRSRDTPRPTSNLLRDCADGPARVHRAAPALWRRCGGPARDKGRVPAGRARARS